MRRKRGRDNSLLVHAAWYKSRYQRGEQDALIEFAAGYPHTSKSTPWFRSAIQELICIFVSYHRREGRSLREISALLNRMGVPPRRGKVWHASSVRLYGRKPKSFTNSPLTARTILMAIYGHEGEKVPSQPWREAIAKGIDTPHEDARLVWELHRLLRPYITRLAHDIRKMFREYERKAIFDREIPRVDRQVEYVRRCYGTRGLPYLSLRHALGQQAVSTLLSQQASPPRSPETLAIEASMIPPLESPEEPTPSEEEEAGGGKIKQKPLLDSFGFIDRMFTKKEFITLATKKVDTALLEILCRWADLSPRTAHRYRPNVQ